MCGPRTAKKEQQLFYKTNLADLFPADFSSYNRLCCVGHFGKSTNKTSHTNLDSLKVATHREKAALPCDFEVHTCKICKSSCQPLLLTMYMSYWARN